MQHQTRRLAVLAGGALVASALIAIACDDAGLTEVPRANEDGDDAGTATTDGKAGPGSPDGASGDDCGAAPRLRSNDKGFFCSFFRRDGGTDAGSTRNCSHDETCCNPGKASDGKNAETYCASTPTAEKGVTDQSSCLAKAAENGSEWPSTGGTTWECGDKNNCAADQVCCMFTVAGSDDKANVGPNLNKQIPTSCNAKQGFKFGGTYCASSCASDDVKLCATTDDNCTSPKKCVPFEIFQGVSTEVRNLGYCN